MRQLFQIIRPLCIALVLYAMTTSLVTQVASAQDAAPPREAAAQVEKESLLDVYFKGGWVMHFIALSSVAVIGVIVVCAIRINRKKLIPAEIEKSLAIALARQDVTEALKICESNQSALSHVIKETFTKAAAGVTVYSKADLESVAAETIFHEETKSMLWVNMLNGLSAVAPMMGLLGTVSGMIGSFDQLAAGATSPSDFAGGIGEAMVSTAAALIVAIPAMFFYFIFKNLLQSLVTELANASSNLINSFISGPSVPAE